MENKQNIKDLINKFYPHAKEKLGFDHPVRVIMRQDAENAQQSLGKTAYYDPAEKLIVLYVTDRHPKDVLRSFSHELVHHAQNCRGELDDLSTDAHYAKDGKGREIEKEAYLQGNLNLRDYEDIIKYEGVNEMKLTKSQLKGLIEQTIEKITEGGGKPDFLDLDKDGDKKEPMKKAAEEKKAVDEQEMPPAGIGDMAAVVNVLAELRELSEMDSSSSRNLQRMGQEQYFRVLADKLERAIQDDAGKEVKDVDGSTANFGSLEELDVDEAHCGGKRDDELEEQEMQPTIKGKKIEIEKEKKTGKDADAITKVAADKRKEKKKIATPSLSVDENNETWYNSNLYESLRSKWTK